MKDADRDPGPLGDAARHLPLETLESALAALTPPRDRGSVELIVSRGIHERRATPERTVLSPAEGVPGDAWKRKLPQKPGAQISLMRVDVARLIANGQPISLAGDNLFVELDLSVANLPTGSRLRVGRALLEVTPEPHNGCARFRQRFGDAALRLTAAPRYRDDRLRGIYARVMEAGEVAVGDGIEVLLRGTAAEVSPVPTTI
jgi:MOSC domain-containing protein YiiM